MHFSKSGRIYRSRSGVGASSLSGREVIITPHEVVGQRASHKSLARIRYRLGQVKQQLGFVEPLAAAEKAEVSVRLSPAALELFETMSSADQRHSLRVCQGLQARGCTDDLLLAAALLHDVGKAGGRVPFWTRPVIVLGKRLAPRLLAKLVVPPLLRMEIPTLSRWRRSLSYAWYHADVGADLAAAAGLPEQAVLYIRAHHQPNGPAAALHAVDEVS